MKKILIYPNTLKNDINLLVLKVIDEIAKHGEYEIFIPDFYKFSIENAKKLKFEKCLLNCDLVITLGGDGTMLSAASEVLLREIPMIGINFGNLGFLTELDITEIHYLENVLKGEYSIEKRMVLEVTIERDSKIIYDKLALNDVIIKTENSFRMMGLELMSDDIPVLSFSGDGVIVATPTGSTAYSMSAGGPIVEPEVFGICVTPICSHKFAGKSFVFSKDRVLKIKPKARNHNLAYIAVDGNNSVMLYENDRVIVKRSQYNASFIRVKGQKFYQVLTEKLGGTFKNEI